MHRRRPTDFAKALDIAQTSGMQDDEPFSGGRPSTEPQPLSLWEKLAIASQEAESRRASLDAATDTVGIDDLSDESIAFGYQQSSDDQSPEVPRHISSADSRFAPRQWETALLCNDVSHWLGVNLESVLYIDGLVQERRNSSA